MQNITQSLQDLLFAFKTTLQGKELPQQYADDEMPLRAELFSAVQMEQHGKMLAGSHRLSTGPARDRLLARLADNEQVLANACSLLTEAVQTDRMIAPAAEWLLDNFYLIEEQIHTAKSHLPQNYSRELPRLQSGPSAGNPRVYDIALEIISHGDGRVDPTSLRHFVSAYQQVTSLKLGELWAIPIMLRLALIENLRRVAARLAISRFNQNLADTWVDQMTATAEDDPSNLILLVADMARSKPPMVGSFVAELARRLQGQNTALTLPLTWISQRLSDHGLTIEQLIQSETQQQAADQVSISNSIGSLRFLGAMDWREFVETMSAVEQTLRQDPAGIYAQMDFATRDHYRHVVEKMAKGCDLEEAEVAARAVTLAHDSQARGQVGERAMHVGYYLIGNGVLQMEEGMAVQLSLSDRLRKFGSQVPLQLFLGVIFALTGLFTAGMLLYAHAAGTGAILLLILGALGFLASSHLSVALVNWMATLLATPNPLPRMDFSKGIPDQARTLVAVPTMLVNQATTDSLVEALEVRFLANRDANVRYCLLTDFLDAQAESVAEDAALLLHAQQRMEQLNLKYAPEFAREQGDSFILLHRPRRWNQQEKIWMGYERKRGKLADLNSFLRGGPADLFMHIVGDTTGLGSVRYVVTLDSDTLLPRDTVRQFVATMAHPLNRPRFDERSQCVVEGYGILQPRVAVSLPSGDASHYEQLFGGEPGIDPYTRTVSDVYQDVFHEGSFIGKGIYDVDAFEKALGGRFPDNQILSHDLLEGCYARCGLLSDVQLYEQYPSRYQADVSRRHRWMRGDWQLFSWLLPSVPTIAAVPGTKTGTKIGATTRSRQKNPLSSLSRWKILDNLRRTLVSAAMVMLLILGWTVLPSPAFWTMAVLAILFLPPLAVTLLDLVRKPDNVFLRQHLSAAMESAGRHFSQALLALVFLPYDAYFSLDAVLRTCWRMLVSHRKLLEWNPSGQSAAQADNSILGSYRQMWFAPALALVTALLLMQFQQQALMVALPILLLWAMSPVVAWRLSLPLLPQEAQLSTQQTQYLHHCARKTWSFFETFVGPQDNWLPPDNMQEHPVRVVAHRTSPTNIGLALLANLTAYDFGYITTGKLLERTGNTLASMAQLERYLGHFYNWYDTQTLQPLQNPVYISSVDSGNLAGHLLTLRPGLLALPEHPILGQRLLEGIDDTLRIAAQMTSNGSLQQLLAQFRTVLDGARAQYPATLSEMAALLDKLAAISQQLAARYDGQPETQAAKWTLSLALQCREACEELAFLVPWIGLPVASDWGDKLAGLSSRLSLKELSNIASALQPAMALQLAGASDTQQRTQIEALFAAIMLGSQRADERIAMMARLAEQASEFAQMEYGFLYNEETNLLAIGYNLSERRRDDSYYDLLASEARLCSFVAIAQGQIPQDNWFMLGRQLTIAGGEPILLSWSGSMFEYLMPLLVMPNYENTLLDQTYKASVQRQIAYGAQRGVPWGISESGYYVFDSRLNYQYRAFGVPGLGLKRGLGADLVVSPYSTMMALMVEPEAACLNLQRLSAEGFEGEYGLYEAIDYTPSRLPRGQTHAVVRSYMAHHQGMGFLSLAYLLLNRPMQARFESDPLFQSTMLVLQERIPKAVAYYSQKSELSDVMTSSQGASMPMRVLGSANTAIPEVQLLSNGRYHVMVTNAGGGYSRWKDLAVTRWREDTTRDNWGTFGYVRDMETGQFWSTAHQPTLKAPEASSYEVIFSEGRAEFRRNDNGFKMHTEIVVSPEDDIELRRSTITNRSNLRRTIEITSYSEVVLAPPAADTAHPAFSNLFVQTEILNDCRAIICSRRPRSVNEQPPLMFHLMAVHGADSGEVSYETDRMKFVGRGNTVAAPQAMLQFGPLANSEVSVLDPIAAIRTLITLDPEQSVTIDMVSGIGENRPACLSLIDKYRDRHLADRVFELAWTHSQVILRQLNATESDAQLYGQLANSVIYTHPLLRAEAGILIKNHRGQSGLWSYAISGDLPIVLLQIKDVNNIDLVRQMVQAHQYWHLKGLAVDLVIWNEDHAGYRQQLQDQIMGMIASSNLAGAIDRPGGFFVRQVEQISVEDRILLQSVARVIITDSKGTLASQVQQRAKPEVRLPRLVPTRNHVPMVTRLANSPSDDLILFNGTGGFAADGREYVIITGEGKQTPAPWVNVLANAKFGSVVSESGQAYTWGENAHEFRLTPWNNDPVTDASGEVFYLRDEESGHYWSPASLPCCGQGPYITRHGFGYSVFEHVEAGIRSLLTVYVALDASVKYSVLKVRNDSGSTRKLSATGYVEWVMGDLRHKSNMHVTTEVDAASGAMFARNPYNTEFAERIAFFDADAITRTVTGDRAEFIGRNGSLQQPAAMGRVRLSGRTGAGLDPCAAIQVPFELADGQEREIVFTLGLAGRRSADASSMVQRYRGATAARSELASVLGHWEHTLGAVQVETPDPALNVLVNGWLMYQTIACRVWARSGYYQSGGAFGFRDQLQDVMAVVHTQPHMLREQLLLCAAHQFVEGDVQHWWHPPTDRGVRTHCSDDYLWLPLAAHRYVTSTGDTGVLDENVHFLEGRLVNPDEDSYYDLPNRSAQSDSLYQHCVRAIERGLRFGERGLPLIGSCDWNDGMDKVGEHGKGESIWLGFFLYDVLTRFSEVARSHGDAAFAGRCLQEADTLRTNLEKNGWDGQWYRRAYFDDGTPLGSSSSPECQIDSISQSWAVLSGAGQPERVEMAMQAVNERLVRREHGLIQLLDPPFDDSELNPGYIKGYVPGVRENGGQYTHAAIWTAMAFAKMGDSDTAWELLRMINPVNHGRTAEDIAIYKVEPYVIAADVYAVVPHIGRGGWTWYTGSSGWMYRLIVESLLGLTLHADKLTVAPRLPADMPGFTLHYRYRSTTYRIVVTRGVNHAGMLVDGRAQEGSVIAMVDDQQTHLVEISLQEPL